MMTYLRPVGQLSAPVNRGEGRCVIEWNQASDQGCCQRNMSIERTSIRLQFDIAVQPSSSSSAKLVDSDGRRCRKGLKSHHITGGRRRRTFPHKHTHHKHRSCPVTQTQRETLAGNFQMVHQSTTVGRCSQHPSHNN
ncbi:hypothetical protein RvY_03278 [Ramazzottius varieornatus]|uniref:Uncharacterized protein n=1 Tax=Ramazzottius varieornatus TaxID=947166 RepID=A0A1D1UUJ2_RAMVA|nr:hypothetical protein RvY_03278 [Ramazzottius varieornatus]